MAEKVLIALIGIGAAVFMIWRTAVLIGCLMDVLEDERHE